MAEINADHALRVFDAHVHICFPDEIEYLWAQREPGNVRATSMDQFYHFSKENDVDSVVLIEAAASPVNIGREVALLDAIWRNDKKIAGIIVGMDPDTAAACGQINAYRDLESVLGVRLLSRYARDTASFLVDHAQSVAKACEAANLICEIGVWSQQLQCLKPLLSGAGDTRFILNHGGKPPSDNLGFQAWARAIAEVAQSQNLTCKLSGFASLLCSQSFAPEKFRPYLEVLYNEFGVERLIFGSDWHMIEEFASYNQVVSTISEVMDDIDHGSSRRIFYDNAHAFYRRK